MTITSCRCRVCGQVVDITGSDLDPDDCHSSVDCIQPVEHTGLDGKPCPWKTGPEPIWLEEEDDVCFDVLGDIMEEDPFADQGDDDFYTIGDVEEEPPPEPQSKIFGIGEWVGPKRENPEDERLSIEKEILTEEDWPEYPPLEPTNKDLGEGVFDPLGEDDHQEKERPYVKRQFPF